MGGIYNEGADLCRGRCARFCRLLAARRDAPIASRSRPITCRPISMPSPRSPRLLYAVADLARRESRRARHADGHVPRSSPHHEWRSLRAAAPSGASGGPAMGSGCAAGRSAGSRACSARRLAEMETRHFVVESTDGPNTDGIYTITAKDVLKLADDDRAQAPLMSNGFLVGAIDADDTSVHAVAVRHRQRRISGLRLCRDRRQGDLRLHPLRRRHDDHARAARHGWPSAHDAGDRVQLVLRL